MGNKIRHGTIEGVQRDRSEGTTRDELLQKAKPILFNTQMVKAILKAEKTETRRAVKHPYFVDEQIQSIHNVYGKTLEFPMTCRIAPKSSELRRQIGEMPYPANPYERGDILYIRETWGVGEHGFIYRADVAAAVVWHPSIHMPKKAARILLRVNDIRVERLQKIGRAGIRAEGVTWQNAMNREIARIGFSLLWNSTLNEKDREKYGWDANPWVWVIEFERIYPGQQGHPAAEK